MASRGHVILFLLAAAGCAGTPDPAGTGNGASAVETSGDLVFVGTKAISEGEIRSRLKDKVMFGSDYPSIPYKRIFSEWDQMGYSDDMLEKFFHGNAELILDL